MFIPPLHLQKEILCPSHETANYNGCRKGRFEIWPKLRTANMCNVNARKSDGLFEECWVTIYLELTIPHRFCILLYKLKVMNKLKSYSSPLNWYMLHWVYGVNRSTDYQPAILVWIRICFEDYRGTCTVHTSTHIQSSASHLQSAARQQQSERYWFENVWRWNQTQVRAENIASRFHLCFPHTYSHFHVLQLAVKCKGCV